MIRYTKKELDEMERITRQSILRDTLCCIDAGICNHDLDWIAQARLRNPELVLIYAR